MNERWSSAGTEMTVNSMDEFDSRKAGADNNSLKSLSSEEVKENMEDGKSLIMIGVNSEALQDTKEGAGELNHEEVGLGINTLDNKEGPSQNEQDHEAYYGEETWSSPDLNTLQTDEKYKDTKARQQLDEIDAIIKEK